MKLVVIAAIILSCCAWPIHGYHFDWGTPTGNSGDTQELTYGTIGNQSVGSNRQLLYSVILPSNVAFVGDFVLSFVPNRIGLEGAIVTSIVGFEQNSASLSYNAMDFFVFMDNDLTVGGGQTVSWLPGKSSIVDGDSIQLRRQGSKVVLSRNGVDLSVPGYTNAIQPSVPLYVAFAPGWNSGDIATHIEIFDCSDPGSWTYLQNCPTAWCPLLTAPAGTTMTVSASYVPSVTYACTSGLTTSDPLTRTCGPDGEWSGAEPQCKASCAGDFAAVPGGSQGTCGSSRPHGETCSIACSSGFALTGSTVRTCNDGVLVGSQSCQAITCARNDTAPAHGTAGTCGVSGGSAAAFGSTCSLTCDASGGYSLRTGSLDRVCGSGVGVAGVWSPVTAVCAGYCEDHPDVCGEGRCNNAAAPTNFVCECNAGRAGDLCTIDSAVVTFTNSESQIVWENNVAIGASNDDIVITNQNQTVSLLEKLALLQARLAALEEALLD